MTRPNRPPTTAVPVEAYSRPHAPPNALRLDGNEGNVPPARLLAELAGQDIGLLRNYPSTSALERDIATRLGVEPQRVVVTAGADDGIDRVCRAFLGPGRQVVLPVPTFEMFYRFAATAGGEVVTIPWVDDYPVDEIISTLGPTTTLVAIVSPNNPTGRVVTADDLKWVARAAASAIVLLDHAYVE